MSVCCHASTWQWLEVFSWNSVWTLCHCGLFHIHSFQFRTLWNITARDAQIREVGTGWRYYALSSAHARWRHNIAIITLITLLPMLWLLSCCHIWQDNVMGVQDLPTRVKILPSFSWTTFLSITGKKTRCTFKPGTRRRTDKSHMRTLFLDLRLDPLRTHTMPTFYAIALDAWYNMAPTVNPNIESTEPLLHEIPFY